MRPGIAITLTAADRLRLEGIIHNRNAPQKHVWRARIILLTDQGVGTLAIMAATGKSKTCVWRWQERFMAEGVDGLLRDKTRPPGIAPLETALVDKVVALTRAQSVDIPKGARHRLENLHDGLVEVIEVQFGDYLGEDDIVRYDDIYNRA